MSMLLHSFAGNCTPTHAPRHETAVALLVSIEQAFAHRMVGAVPLLHPRWCIAGLRTHCVPLRRRKRWQASVEASSWKDACSCVV